MSYRLPTVSEFKSQFSRDFPYAVPAWGAAGSLTMVAGIITAVALTTPGRGYSTAPDVSVADVSGGGTGAAITAAVANGKVTGFTLVAGGNGYVSPSLVITPTNGDETNQAFVTDDDIDIASTNARVNVNEELFCDQATFSQGFLYLQAHMLVDRISAATQGLRSQYAWITTAKTVGNLSQTMQIPEKILGDPFLAALARTQYGALYLQLISPLLTGNFSTAFRQSLP